MSREFLPVTRAEMEERGIWQPDFVYISGDAYVDHYPSSGEPGVFRRYYFPARLAEKREHFRFWRAQAGLSGFCRKYGFYGEPLYRGEKAPKAGFLFSGRTDGAAPGPGGDGLRQSDSSDV